MGQMATVRSCDWAPLYNHEITPPLEGSTNNHKEIPRLMGTARTPGKDPGGEAEHGKKTGGELLNTEATARNYNPGTKLTVLEEEGRPLTTTRLRAPTMRARTRRRKAASLRRGVLVNRHS